MKRSPMELDTASAHPESESGGPRSLSRVLRLFSVLADSQGGMSLAELSVVLDSPKSSLLNLLRPLVADGFLVHANGLYALGPALFRLSATVLAAWDFPKLIHPFLQELAEKSGETALLGVLNREADAMVYVDVINSPQPVRYQIPVGTMRPLYASAAGRLLLAYADADYQREYLANVKFKSNIAKPLTKTDLVQELEHIRRDGYSVSIDAYLQGLSAIAAPVLDAEGVCVASINLAGPTERFKSDIDFLKSTVLEIASQASGFPPTKV